MKIIFSTGGSIRAVGRKILTQNMINKSTIIKTRVTNLKHYMSNIAKYGNFDFFDAILIETATACNRRCSYCPNSIYDRGQVGNNKLMDVDLYKKIIDDLADMKYKGTVKPFNFNEPLLDKRLLDLVRYTREKLPKSNIHIATNGDYLTFELYKKLIDAGITAIYITPHRETMPDHIKGLFAKLKDRDDKVTIKYNHLTPESTLANRGGLVQVKQRSPIPRCVIAPITIQISYEGNAFLCCNDYFGKYTFGNVREKSIKEIWKDPAYVNKRKELRKGVYKYEICKKCMA